MRLFIFFCVGSLAFSHLYAEHAFISSTTRLIYENARAALSAEKLIDVPAQITGDKAISLSGGGHPLPVRCFAEGLGADDLNELKSQLKVNLFASTICVLHVFPGIGKIGSGCDNSKTCSIRFSHKGTVQERPTLFYATGAARVQFANRKEIPTFNFEFYRDYRNAEKDTIKYNPIAYLTCVKFDPQGAPADQISISEVSHALGEKEIQGVK